MKLLLIDKREERTDILQEKFQNAGFEVTLFPYSWGEEEGHELWNERQDECLEIINEQFKILFIHSRNSDLVSRFIAEFLEQDNNRLAVSYTGILTGSEINIDRQNHHAFSSSVDMQGDANWNLNAFKEAIEKNDPNPFYKLTGFDPELEASIHLWKSLRIEINKREEVNLKELINKIEAKYDLNLLTEDEHEAILKEDNIEDQTNLLSKKLFQIRN